MESREAAQISRATNSFLGHRRRPRGDRFRGRPLTSVTVGNGGGSGDVTATASKADTEQVAKVLGQKDAFAIALERIKEPHHQENVEFGMAILLKIDLKESETELYEALGP